MDPDVRRIAHNWDRVAEQYHDHLAHELDHKLFDREILGRFAEMVPRGLTVLDIGCGPGHITGHLSTQGLEMVGVDLSPNMVVEARRHHPDIEFRVGDMLEVEFPEASIGGVLALYSVINIPRDMLGPLFRTWNSWLTPGAPLLVSTHAGEGTMSSESLFETGVPMTINLYRREELEDLLDEAGFTVIEAHQRGPYPEEVETQRVYVLATTQ